MFEYRINVHFKSGIWDEYLVDAKHISDAYYKFFARLKNETSYTRKDIDLIQVYNMSGKLLSEKDEDDL